MRTLKFYGSSDDLFEMESTIKGESDEFSDNAVIIIKRGVKNEAFEKKLKEAVSVLKPRSMELFNKMKNAIEDDVNVEGIEVSASYAPGKAGCWHIGIGPLEEDMMFPAWPMRFYATATGYSTVMEIDVPDDAKITVYNKRN